MTDIVERLRSARTMPFKEAHRLLFIQAADEIERWKLRAELSETQWERAEAEIERLRTERDDLLKLSKLEKEANERLREALVYEAGMYQSLYEQAKSGTPLAQYTEATAETADKTATYRDW